MTTLGGALLARDLALLDGVRTLTHSILDKDEVRCPIPSEFPVVLGLVATGDPGEVLHISVNVLSHVGRPIRTISEQHHLSGSGLAAIYCPFDIPVRAMGPCFVLLKFGNAEVWRQRIFFVER
jgi:hypothetical protein